MGDIPTQAWTVGGGVVGGALGYLLGGQKVLWTAVGAFLGALVGPPASDAAAALLTPTKGQTYTANLAPGRTIIVRASVGDTIVVNAPSGWGVPSATANIPGFLEIESTDASAESTTLRATATGQGQVQMTSDSEVAVLSVDVS